MEGYELRDTGSNPVHLLYFLERRIMIEVYLVRDPFGHYRRVSSKELEEKMDLGYLTAIVEFEDYPRKVYLSTPSLSKRKEDKKTESLMLLNDYLRYIESITGIPQATV